MINLWLFPLFNLCMYEKKYATLKLINKRLLIMQLHCGKTTDWDQHQVSHKTLMLHSAYIDNDFKLSFFNENSHIFCSAGNYIFIVWFEVEEERQKCGRAFPGTILRVGLLCCTEKPQLCNSSVTGHWDQDGFVIHFVRNWAKSVYHKSLFMVKYLKYKRFQMFTSYFPVPGPVFHFKWSQSWKYFEF